MKKLLLSAVGLVALSGSAMAADLPVHYKHRRLLSFLPFMTGQVSISVATAVGEKAAIVWTLVR